MPQNDPTTVGGLVIKDIMICENNYYTPYLPYSNICPISGWTEAEVNVAGVNVWDEEWEVYGANGQVRSKNAIPLVEGATYYAKTSIGFTLYFKETPTGSTISTKNVNNETFVVPQGCHYAMMYTGTGYGSTYKNDISINYPSTDHDYHAYEGDTYTADLPQTVYGGWVDLVKGAADSKDTHAIVTYDGTENWGKDSDISSGTIHRFYLQNNDIKKYTDYSDKLLCNKCLATNNYSYVPSIGDFAVTAYSIMSNNDNYVYILSKTIDTVAGIKAWLAEEPLQLWYPKATPTDINIQGQTVPTLYGRNNVWSEQGDVDVTYKADIQLYIDKKTNELAVAIAAL